MTAGRSQTTSAMDCCLEEVLSIIEGTATAVGADSVAVAFVENSGSIRLVYQWPEADWSGGQVGDLPHGTIERFLKQMMAASSDSLVVVPWPAECAKVAIAFGFLSAQPARLAETLVTLRLAALATWTSFEARRLRRELTVVSERLGQRKMVERAKSLLQAQHGWSEPQAYEHLRKLSRQRRKPMAEVAQAVLRTG